ncbi:MAG: glycosyltransferase involved in cell wall biosynthesis [Mariniflexile sp.]|jgi:glycosyltransferase involved in cell wall biosynthesis
MKVDFYDYIIVTNLPAFYKINLYNQLAKKLKIKVIFMSASSAIRAGDFSKGDMKFDHVFLSDKNYEERNKLLMFVRVAYILFSSRYKRIVFPGWELVELIPLIFLLPTKKNGLLLESSIIETKSTGLLWFLKKLIMKNMGHAFPSGNLQNKILQRANYSGEVHITHGVGIPNRLTKRAFNLDVIKNDCKYLYVGRVASEKNLQYLVKMFNDNGKRLTIAGNGPLLDELKLLAESNITFLGYVNNEELAGVYKSHDVFILPSYSEPWGLVVDEALWFGLPVVVSCNVGCSEDLVIKENTGTIFKLDDDSSFTKALFEVESNYSKYKSNVMAIDFNKRDQEQIDSYMA